MISLDCPDQRRCQSIKGRLPADDESHTVTVVVTGLETDTQYRYTVEASSPAGATTFSGEFESIPPGAAPKGVKDEEVYVPPELPWANQNGNEAAARTVAEQRAKEHEEQQAKEAAATKEQEESKARAAAVLASEEAVRKRHAEESAASAAQRGTPACVVPSLRGDTLTSARWALSKANCRLGKVSRPKGHHNGRLVVTQQRVVAGKKMPRSAPVGITLGSRRP
jgi:hypothetical protein